jgi:hypothetical protein
MPSSQLMVAFTSPHLAEQQSSYDQCSTFKSAQVIPAQSKIRI